MAFARISDFTSGGFIAALVIVGSEATPAMLPMPDAFSTWSSDASIIQTGNKQAVITGTLGGPLFVESDKGIQDGGDVDCPASINVDLVSGEEQGSGSCVFTTEDGAKAFGSWSCAGYGDESCDGQFAFRGGTGEFVGLSGWSNIRFLTSRDDIREASNGAVVTRANGVTLWPQFRLPAREPPTDTSE